MSAVAPQHGWRTAARLAVVGLITTFLGCSSMTSDAPPGSLALLSQAPGKVVGMRRLTEAQYRNAIADVFGSDIQIGGRFDPIVRPEHDLIATGASEAAISPAGFEQFDTMARTIAEQVFDKSRRDTFLSCQPRNPTQADTQCTRSFYQRVGVFIFRRPLTTQELRFYVDLAERGAEPTHDFYAGLQLGLAAMLVSPEFLYRVETVGPDGRQLDGWSKASRLSFLIWNSIPDEALLTAAARGDLEDPAKLKSAVERMIASPKSEQGVRAFFTDFLELDRVADLSKDTVVYPRFNSAVAKDLSEQMLLTVVDHLMTQDRPYPELFTTRKTFLNRNLGLLYKAPVSTANGWEAYEFPADSDRAGILGQGAFLALFSHEGRSSPTLRGRAIREVLFCQVVPNPPPNVDFSGFNDTHNAVLRTARQRLAHHATDPVCASCHRITDPLGLSLERFDGEGSYRDQENGTMIDASGTFNGKSFDGAAALGYLFSQSTTPTQCVVQRLAQYATGTTEDGLPKGWTTDLNKTFEASGYKFHALLEDVARSPEFFAAPGGDMPATKVAQFSASAANTVEVH